MEEAKAATCWLFST